MNRFYDIEGDVSTQLAPWTLRAMGLPVGALFQLKQPIRFRSDIAGGDIVVPVGYCSDLASIPQFAWSIFMASDDPRIELGGWVHDFLYGNRGILPGLHPLTRAQCDDVLCNEAMIELGASGFQCAAVYRALRMFGQGHWDAK